MTNELRQAIDEEIYNYYPELFANEAADLQSTNGDWNIPRLHVDDLKHYLGELANDIPSRYKRRDGKRDIDTVAQEMGYDDIDSFINEIHRVLEARRNVRAGKQRLAELRRDPDTAIAKTKIRRKSWQRYVTPTRTSPTYLYFVQQSTGLEQM